MLSVKTNQQIWILAFTFLVFFFNFSQMIVPPEEVDALERAVATMGTKYWKFNSSSCKLEIVGMTEYKPSRSVGDVHCDCTITNNGICHVRKIVIKGHSLPGVLPPELVKLPYLNNIDFAYNYLNGTIPKEWASIKFISISLLGNRLSGEFPKALTNITSLTYLNLEANQFSGTLPVELGRLINMQDLIISSNQLTGGLPTSLSELSNLTDLRISDNNFSGSIPDFIKNWKQLTRLEIMGTGLTGPIPSNISLLDKLTELRIADIKGPLQELPDFINAEGFKHLQLRNCNIIGEIPEYILKIHDLVTLDLSFNKLVGEIPDGITARNLKFVLLAGNLLSGNVPESMDGDEIDLSYNNFTWQGPEQPVCLQNNKDINLFRSSSSTNNLRNFVPCTKDFTCPKYVCSLHINCGGNDSNIKEENGDTNFEGDGEVKGGSAKYYRDDGYWGFSSTGTFMYDDYSSDRFVISASSTNLSELYNTARVSPVSLTYFGYCLENGNYTVSLHFAEIVFHNDNTYSSLGRRMFDIYIKDELVLKDFNIANEAGGAMRPIVKHFNATVEDNTLDIRFYWNGKGTSRLLDKIIGASGPLISAISVNPRSRSCTYPKKKNIAIYIIIGVLAVLLAFSMLGILWWKGCIRGSRSKKKDPELEHQIVSYTLKQMKAATKNFDASNKIGEGGFGPVYKGTLSDGTVVAVKQLSSVSLQGSKEFLNEVRTISCLQHPNLVKLHGCCIEGKQLLLVYEYLKNNSLARALFSKNNLDLDWPTRYKICTGIARGLAFLHEEAKLKVVHRDIKATNVLLDEDLNPKISDFGLARLNEGDQTHISTRIAGTLGYMAPEYALWGHLTYKADVYSFGIVTLEIVTGQNNRNYIPRDNLDCLLDWAWHLHQNSTIEDILDQRLGGQVNKEEAQRLVSIALLCTNASPLIRPTMSEVVCMLEGDMAVPEVIPSNNYTEFTRLRALRDLHGGRSVQGLSARLTRNSTASNTDIRSSSTHYPTPNSTASNTDIGSSSTYYPTPNSTTSNTDIGSSSTHYPIQQTL